MLHEGAVKESIVPSLFSTVDDLTIKLTKLDSSGEERESSTWRGGGSGSDKKNLRNPS